jgi:excisionase family DNA binding protein
MRKLFEVYTVEEVARALKLHPYTVRRLCRERKIPAFKFGGQWRFDVKEIEEWKKEQRKSCRKYK